MRALFATVGLVIVLATPSFGAGYALNTYDLTSGAQSLTVQFTHKFTGTVSVPYGQSGPTTVVLDYMYPTEALGEWGSFQTRSGSSSYDYAFHDLSPTFEWFSGQWMRVTWTIPANFNWSFPVEFWVQYNFVGTRAQTLSGVSNDLSSDGGNYTTITTNVTAQQPVYDFIDYCFTNPVTGQVTGNYGAIQRTQGYLHAGYSGNCISMSMLIAAAMRHINIPASIGLGYTVGGTFSLPMSSTRTMNVTFTASPTIGHCVVGGWRNDDVFVPFDTSTKLSQFAPLQFVMVGYYEDPADAIHGFYTFGGSSQQTLSTSYIYSNASGTGSQTYSWDKTRRTTETTGSGNYDLFAQKITSSYHGGSGIIGGEGGGTTGVGENPHNTPTPLAIFPAAIRPVRAGEQLYVEIGAPEDGVEASLQLYDVQGRMIPNFGFEGRVVGYSTKNLQVPDSLGSGVYYALLTFNGEKVDTDQIVVIR